jgi:putative lipoic acid-binding regulatory protein
MDADANRKRPKIDYPTKWGYKIIGKDVDKLLRAVEESILGLEYEVKFSNVSRNEKYYSLNVTVLVPSEVVRDLVFQKLNDHPDVTFLI